MLICMESIGDHHGARSPRSVFAHDRIELAAEISRSRNG